MSYYVRCTIMLLTIRQSNLNACLSVVEKSLNAKTTLTVLQGILWEAGADYLRLVSNNLELSIQAVERELNVMETGSVILPEKVVEIVRQLPDGEVKISMN